jgi:hypothetical protein
VFFLGVILYLTNRQSMVNNDNIMSFVLVIVLTAILIGIGIMIFVAVGSV